MMPIPNFKRLPRHVGVIPDGNRRWAVAHGMDKEQGYVHGIGPGLALYSLCLELGIPEITFYGFTQDNTKRPSIQRKAFQSACVEAVHLLGGRDASILVVGNSASPMFPSQLMSYTGKRVRCGKGSIRVNFLINYSWSWDLEQARASAGTGGKNGPFSKAIGSRNIARIDLIIRWGGRRRLSGLLPVQSVYADFYIVNELWPDFKPQHVIDALRWYESQDITLGG